MTSANTYKYKKIVKETEKTKNILIYNMYTYILLLLLHFKSYILVLASYINSNESYLHTCCYDPTKISILV